MTQIFSTFLADILGEAFSALDASLLWMLDGMLHVETLLDGAFSAYITVDTITTAYSFIYTLAAALVVLKFLFKGFQIYILWRDGDADASPQDMIIGSLQAAAAILIFPTLYDIMADVTIQVARSLMGIFRIGVIDESYFDLFSVEALGGLGLFLLILVLIYLIMALVLCVKMISRGFELLVLRVGYPIACVGLVDSDFGVFKGYVQILFKTMFTSIIQIILMSLSFRVITGFTLLSIVSGIALVMTAFSTPVLMQQILVPGGRGGGGLTSKIYTASMAARAIRGLVGK